VQDIQTVHCTAAGSDDGSIEPIVGSYAVLSGISEVEHVAEPLGPMKEI
jgi:hypothetical protein